MKSLKASKAKLSLLLTLCVTFLCCVTMAFTGIFGNKISASADTVALTLDSDGKFDKTGLESLFQKLGGGNLDTLKQKVDATTEKAIPVSDTKVTLGGLSWHVVYVSKVNKPASEKNNGSGEQGDVVATLWLEGVGSNKLGAIKWNEAYSGGTTTHPYNLYGTASISTAIQTTWASILDDYGDYIATPAQIGYQATEDFHVAGYGDYSLPGEAYGDLTGVDANWTAGFDYTATEGYSDWQFNKLWLPSLTEIGYLGDGSITGVSGLWQITDAQRATEGSALTWTRSGVPGNYTSAYALYPQGNYTTTPVNSSVYARPALHLNISEAYRTEADDETDIANNLGSLNSFFKDLTNGTNTYKAVEDMFAGNTSGTLTTKQIGGGNAVKVNFGGLQWTVTGLSKVAVTGYPSNGGVGEVGDIVATLWLDDAWQGEGLNAQWNAVDGGVYGESSLRNLMVASDGAEIWRSLINSYGTYLSSPAQIGYQITSITTSAAWQYDKVWLPALTEVTDNGTWALEASGRGNTVEQNVWLRSVDQTGNPHYLAADGSSASGATTDVYAVRPAIHVNLKALALKGYGENLPEVTNATVEYNGQLQEVVKYDGEGVTLLRVEFQTGDAFVAVDDSIYNKDDCDTLGVLKISDVGTFKITFALKNAKTDFNSNEGAVWNTGDVYATQTEQTENKSVTVTVTPRKLTVNWTDGADDKFEYGYNAAGQHPDVFDYEFEEGENAYDYLEYTYFDVDDAPVSGVPTQAGRYTVKVKLADNTKYFVLVDDAGDIVTESKKEYRIIPVSHGNVNWTGNASGEKFVYEFNGEEQTPAAQAFGLFDGDSANELNLVLTYASKGSSRYSSDVPVLPGNYVIRVTDEDGNYYFATQEYQITKKKVEVSWAGDGLSTYENYTFVWMYDGEMHIPHPTANVTGVIFNGSPVTSLKLNPVNAVSKEVSVNNYVATASLDNSDDINAYFELVGNTQSYRIIECAITSIEWRYYSGEIISGEPSFQYIEVYGTEGPRMSAYGVAMHRGQDENNQPVNTEIKIKLLVRYSSDTANNYWSEGTYYAEVGFATTDDSNYCSAIDSLDRNRINFTVTGLVTSLKKIDVIWAVKHEGAYYTLDNLAAAGLGFVTVENGVFTYIYNGEAQSPVAIYLKGDEYVELDISESTYANVGTYSVYLMPSTEFQFDDDALSCAFAIKPLDVQISWTGDGDVEDFVWTYDGTAKSPVASASSAVSGIDLTVDASDITYTSATNAGEHTSYAAVSANYNIVSGATQSFTINKKVITADDVVWTDENGKSEDANGDFIWIYDGKAHTLKVEIKSGFGFAPVFKVVGEATDVGTHYAYAVLDSTKEINDNFAVSEISHEFIITRLTVNAVTWLEESNGEIVFDYDGQPHVPTAVYIPNPDAYDPDDEATFIKLSVWGEMTDAGTYVAYITNDYYFEGGIDRCTFTIRPAELEVEWTVKTYTYNTKAQSPEITFTGVAGDGSLVKGTDYTLSEFVNAGTHVSALTLLNKNYVLKAGEEDTCEFTIGKFAISADLVEWTGDDDATETDGVYFWQYNALPHSPEVKAVVDADAESFINSIAFSFGYSGVSQTVDKHTVTAYVVSATFDGKDVTDNIVLTAECSYEITPFEITEIIWYKDDAKLAAGEACEWTYDGADHAPTAYYVNWDGEEVLLKVDGGRINAGSNYTATALQPVNCTLKCDATKTFSISKQVITVITWYKDDVKLEADEACEWDYDGVPHNPTATFTALDKDGNEFEVELNVTGGALNAVAKCTATASLKDVNNYEFASELETSLDFSIKAMQVYIVWEEGDAGERDWTYSGKLICPVAYLATYDDDTKEFTKVPNAQGNDTTVPVIGGAVAVGDYKATAFDIFPNYDFIDGAAVTLTFNIVEKSLDSFNWSTQPDADGNYNFEFGSVKLPEAVTMDANAGVVYTVYLVGEDDALTKVATVTGAGTYKIVASSDNANYVVPEDSASITVVVTAKSVSVVWGETELVYDGTALKPVAWYVDVNGQKIKLDVTVDEDSTAEGEYTAVASLPEGVTDYTLGGDASKGFKVTKNTADEVEWNWDDTKWDIKEATDGEGTDGETTPTPAPDTSVTTSVKAASVPATVSAQPATVLVEEEQTEEEVVEETPAQACALNPVAVSTVAYAAEAAQPEMRLMAADEVSDDTDVLEPDKQQITFEKKKLSATAEVEE